ncbi:MAG: stage II sporulation protein R [Syntrophomonadaceae bacterium]|nr:stage II sporulation protein R [Syntrophomonadaceae bacterium]
MKNIIVSILVLLLVLLGGSYYYAENKPLQDSVFRLHVIANSDSIEDQALKIAVKNEIVKLLKDEFSAQQDLEQARKLAQKNIPLIQEKAREVITQQGYDYPVEVKVGEYPFPTKSYGNLVFPAGEYQALRICIGQGQGKNWWCVLFPPLCMVSDSDQGLSFDRQEEAQVSIKCLELLPKGVKVKLSSQ